MFSSRFIRSGSLIYQSSQRSSTPSLPQLINLVRYKSAPINKANVPQIKPECEIKTPEKILPNPVQQVLINKLPVEYHGCPPGQFNDETIWYPIYKFPYIGSLRMLVRVKLYMTGTSLGIATYKLYQFVLDPSLYLGQAIILSAFSLSGLLFIGNLFRKFVVQIYASDDAAFIRFCRYTFFGNRLDMVLPKECVVSLSETNKSKRKSFLTIQTTPPDKVNLEYDNYEYYDETYRLTLSFGGILDEERFEKALGKISTRKMD